jgi:hypothetical protein
MGMPTSALVDVSYGHANDVSKGDTHQQILPFSGLFFVPSCAVVPYEDTGWRMVPLCRKEDRMTVAERIERCVGGYTYMHGDVFHVSVRASEWEGYLRVTYYSYLLTPRTSDFPIDLFEAHVKAGVYRRVV